MGNSFTEKDLMEFYDRWEHHYWWHLARKRILTGIFDKLLPSDGLKGILDIGCGIGNDVIFLDRYGSAYGVDVSLEVAPYWKKKGLSRQVIGDGASLPYKSGAFSAVAAFDVLEHLENDQPCIDEIARVTMPGGYLLLTVPAYNFLMSPGFDQLHYRRYNRGEIRIKMEDAGFEMIKATYFNTFLFPIVLVERIHEKLVNKKEFPYYAFEKIPKTLNSILQFIFSLEAPLLKRVNFPFGSSVLLIGRKAGE